MTDLLLLKLLMGVGPDAGGGVRRGARREPGAGQPLTGHKLFHVEHARSRKAE